MSIPEHTRAIVLGSDHGLTDKSVEIARIWVTDGAGSKVWLDTRALRDPKMFGNLMADTIRHAARGYVERWGGDEGDMLQAMVDGIGDELRDQFVASAKTAKSKAN